MLEVPKFYLYGTIANISTCLVWDHFLAILAKESFLKKGQKMLGIL